MPTVIFPHAYDGLVDEDIEWLKENTNDTLERRHIIDVLEYSKKQYREEYPALQSRRIKGEDNG